MASEQPHKNGDQQKYKIYNSCNIGRKYQQLNKRCVYAPYPVGYAPASILSSLTTPQQPKFENAVIVLDFNDTLFPTSKYCEISARSGNKGFRSNVTDKEKEELKELSYYTYNLLSTYIAQYSKQNICIVTTSSLKYIQKIFKQVWNIGQYAHIYNLIFDPYGLDKDTDRILMYHPTDFDEDFSDVQELSVCIKDWDFLTQIVIRYKLLAFARIVSLKRKSFIDHSIKLQNVFVIIGDSVYEHAAAEQLRAYIKLQLGENSKDEFVVNRIKLKHKPSICALTEEHYILNKLSRHGHHSLLNEGFDLDYLKERNNKLRHYFWN